MANEVVTGAGTSPSVMDNIGNVLQNKLFLQYLSGVGGAMNEGKPIGPAMNAITQQNIQSQNMMKLFKTLLNPADDSKATFDGSGMNIKAGPTSALFSSILGGGGETPNVDSLLTPAPKSSPIPTSTVTNPTPVAPTPTVGGGSAVPNPFVGDFSASDLAGLTSQDIATAFGFKMKQEEMRSEKPFKDLQAENLKAELDAKTPTHEIPGIGKVNTSQYLAWLKENNPTEHEKYLRSLMTDPKLKSIALELAKAGAINLGQKVEEKKTMSELGGQLYFNDPKWTGDLSKHIENFTTKDLWDVKDKNGKPIEEKDRPLAIAKERVKFIENKIAAGNGVIQTVKMDKDNKTMIWTVQWPSGDVKTIKQAVR